LLTANVISVNITYIQLVPPSNEKSAHMVNYRDAWINLCRDS